MIGLRTDGTLCSNSIMFPGDWSGLVAVSTCGNLYHTIGLKADGTVAVSDVDGAPKEAEQWHDIIAVAGGGKFVVGLKKDGTVVAAGHTQAWKYDVSDWADVVAIAAGDDYVLGLRSDGTILVTGEEPMRATEGVSSWTNIVSISCGKMGVIGIDSSGNVVSTGSSVYADKSIDQGWRGAAEWSGMAQVAAGQFFSIGQRLDGSVVVNNGESCQVDASDWTDIKLP